MAERIDHTETLWSALDWLVHNDVHNNEIDPKYADDITYIRSLQAKINQAERLIPPMLEEEGPFVNKIKNRKISCKFNIKYRMEEMQMSWVTAGHRRRYQAQKRPNYQQLQFV